jgi:benzoate membrane transport protein
LPLERPLLPVSAPRQWLADFGGVYFGNAIVAFLFACTGPVAIILSVGAAGGLSESDIASWIFGAFFINGLLSITMSAVYRQPLVFLWSIPGAVLVGPALGHLGFAEVIGAFLATGLLMLLLGLSGWVRRAMEMVPMPIVMAMVAGVFLRFGIGLVLAFRNGFALAATMTAVWLALTVARSRVPPLVAALVAGAMVIALQGSFRPPATLFAFAAPNIYAPVFSWNAMVELVIPLAITVLVVQNGQGIAVLTANGHQPPVNTVTAACGLGSILIGVVGSVSTCLTGPVNAILAASGVRERQYTSAIVVAAFAMVFGLLAPFFTRVLLATPPAFIATLAGLAMLRVLQTAFTTSFGGAYSFGALVCFLVTVADVPIFNIGAAFWGLVLGLAASYLLERK